MARYDCRTDFDDQILTKPIKSELLLKLTEKLSAIKVNLKKIDSAMLFSKTVRATFSDIRRHRNTVTRVLGILIPRHASLRADLLRVERVIESETSKILGNNLLPLSKNMTESQARAKNLISDWYDRRCEIKCQLAVLEELINYAKIIREELKLAFDESSRALSSIELEFKVSRSDI